MPIHDQGYQRYRGRRVHGSRLWWVIARNGLRERLRERRFLWLMLAAWFPFLVQAVRFYASSNLPQAAASSTLTAFLAPSAETFRQFLQQQGLFVFFIAIHVGSRLIADDRRANALQIYLSKPLTRVEYVVGKLVILSLLLLLVTWVPAILLLVLQVLFAGDVRFLQANLFLFPAITLFAFIEVALAAFTMLALSSLSKSRRFVSIMFAAMVFFTAALSQALQNITGSTTWAAIAPARVLEVIGDAIFRMPATPAIPVAAALAVAAALFVASVVVLERRVRGVEVVA